MKDLIIRADALALKILTRIVQWYVQRSDFKKHKVDFEIRMQQILLAFAVLWATIIPGMLYGVAGEVVQGAIHVGMWSMLCVFDYFRMQHTIAREKPMHDLFFSMRENERVYAMQKEVLAEMFVSMRRMRLTMIAMVVGLTIGIVVPLYFLHPGDWPGNFTSMYLLIGAAFQVIKIYLVYVFDFDPPKKKKKASEKISEMLQRMWADLVGGLSPSPMPA